MISELLSQLSPSAIIIFWILSGVVLIQLFYILFFYFRLALSKPKSFPTQTFGVSVVLCAKNEAENLLENIPLIMEQDYPNFEIVVVNDSSWDETEDVLKALTSKYDNIKVLKLNEDIQRMGGKKFGLTLGIKSAKYDVVLLTDADCKPLSNTWISEMANSMEASKRISLGVSLLSKGKGIWKNFFRFESIHTAINYISIASAGIPYMGVGRNLMYHKEEFFSVGGFRKHMHVPGGDDDLFVNEIANKSNTAVNHRYNAQTTSDSEDSFMKWFRQKKRHLYSSKQYKMSHKALLAFEPFSWWTMWLCSLILLVLHTPPLLVISLLALRYFLVYGIFIAIGKKWNAADAVWAFPVWEVFLNTMKPVIMLSNKISKPKKWM